MPLCAFQLLLLLLYPHHPASIYFDTTKVLQKYFYKTMALLLLYLNSPIFCKYEYTRWQIALTKVKKMGIPKILGCVIKNKHLLRLDL